MKWLDDPTQSRHEEVGDVTRLAEECGELRRRVAELEAERAGDLAQQKDLQALAAANQALAGKAAKRDAILHDLAERNKELSCLYAISKVVESANLGLSEILQKIVVLLPPAWQFPEFAAARISHGSDRYSTEGFEESGWLQSAPINVEGLRVGLVEVCYLAERPLSDEGPFSIQERRLIDMVAERLGRIIERVQLQGRSAQLEARLRAFYDESPRAIGFSRDGVTVGANPAYLKLFGYASEAELVGRSLLEQISPSARAEIVGNIEARVRGEAAPCHYETRGLRKDGSEFPFEVHVSRIDLAEGPVTAVFIEDITKRREAEAAVARSEARFRRLVEGGRDAIAVIDAGGRVLYASPNVARVTGYPVEEREGQSTFQNVHPEDRAAVASALRRLIAEGPGASTTIEFRALRRDGSEWWGEANASNLLEDPCIAGIVINYRETTERKRAEESLRQSEARFRDIAHVHAGIVWEADDHFTMTHLSGRVREILGYEPGEILGRTVFDLVDPEDRDRVGAAFAKLGKSREPLRDVESWCGTKSGRRVRLSISGVPFSSPDGRLLGVRGTHLDVTELYWSRHRRELLLRLHQISAENDSAINALLCEGFAAETESPLSFFGLVEPDGSAMVVQAWSPSAHSDCRIDDTPLRFPIATAGLWADPIRRGQAVIINESAAAPGRCGLPEGHVPITRYLGVPIMKEGRVIAVAGLANRASPYDQDDVSRAQLLASGISDFLASRNAERAARESDQRLRTFVDFTSDWEYWRRPDGRHEYDSPSCERITGYPAQELLADPDLVSRMVLPEDRPAFNAHVGLEQARGPETMQTEFRILRRTGEVVWIQHACRLVFEADGTFAGTRVSNRDVTERKTAEEERIQLQEQLHHAQKMEAIGTLAGGVAHDFNNILGGVLGGLSLLELEMADAGEGHRAEITDMKELVRRGAELAKQLLGFSRRGKYNARPLDVCEVVRKTAMMFGRTHRDIVIVQDFAPDLDAALMDHAQLEQVLLNLFLNAAYAMPGGGHLMLRASNATLSAGETEPHGAKPGRFVKLVVADTGTGIDAATLPRIFEPFFTTKAPGKGSGLGLASVYGIVKNHGGIVTVESELGKGAAFTLLLPAGNRPAVVAPAPVNPVRPGHGTVLVVDDEERLLHLCGRLLQAMGYQVLTASGGRAAVELMRQHHTRISLVILDLTMPEMSGARTFEAIRAISPTVKVLIASGASVEGQAQELLDKGCSGFIQKPFDAAALSEKIQSLS
jgi:two-component system, cell cycle sensor histidine kinase and response regulator CckA